MFVLYNLHQVAPHYMETGNDETESKINRMHSRSAKIPRSDF